MPEYRYTLTRDLAPLELVRYRLCWVMLNPSTADETKDDQTIKAIKKFTAREGYTDLIVVNLFAARATHPTEMLAMADPVGEGNGPIIGACIESAERVVFAWGATIPRRLQPIADISIEFATSASKMVGGALCLGRTKGGHPRHPSRLADATPFEEFT